MTGKHFAIGPANYAGQAYHWAEAVKEHLQVPAVSFAPSDTVFRIRGARTFQFPVHWRLPHHRISTAWGKAILTHAILRDKTHLAVDGFLPMYGRMNRSDLEGDLQRLGRRGLRIALISHGSDLRDPDQHMSRYEFSFYSSAPAQWVDYMRRHSRRNRSIAESLGLPLFVSTPDLLLDAPQAQWLPLCTDLARWSPQQAALECGVPTVLHLPSRRIPPIKGTDVIDPVLRKLAERGRIRYVSPDSVRHASMPDLVRGADIIVDQILTGSYGVAAVEGMAAGRLVVGFVGKETRALMPAEPPIVDAPPTCFSDVMDEILLNRERFAAQATAGPVYVRKWHSGAASAAALRPFLA